jgi:hypothetical protein
MDAGVGPSDTVKRNVFHKYAQMTKLINFVALHRLPVQLRYDMILYFNATSTHPELES